MIVILIETNRRVKAILKEKQTHRIDFGRCLMSSVQSERERIERTDYCCPPYDVGRYSLPSNSRAMIMRITFTVPSAPIE